MNVVHCPQLWLYFAFKLYKKGEPIDLTAQLTNDATRPALQQEATHQTH